MKSFGDMLLCLFQDVGDVRAPAVVFERAKRGIHNGDGKISVVRAELTGLSGSTTFRKHFELLAKHVTFGNFQFFARSSKCRSEEHTSELQSLTNLVCRLLLEKKNYSTASLSVCEKDSSPHFYRSL